MYQAAHVSTAGVAPVTENSSPMNQLVQKTAALAAMQRTVTDVGEYLVLGNIFILRLSDLEWYNFFPDLLFSYKLKLQRSWLQTEPVDKLEQTSLRSLHLLSQR